MPETTASPAEMPKAYSPREHEDRIRERWDGSGAFHAEAGPVLRGEKPPYCILIPPPNVTAALHLGHALNNTLQDVLIRVHRMKGFETLWMPGTDHAGIATQAVVDKRLQAEGQPSLKDYKKLEAEGENGRERFVARVQAWKDEYEATITDQLKRMGASCDWERQRFTMDPVCARAVREAFFRLFKAGLIYRGKRLVNWDPVLQTALADDELEMREVEGKFYYMRYPLVRPSTNPDDPKDCQEVAWNELAARGYPGAEALPGEENSWVTVATTRPETYLGDTAVAVNPRDPRAGSLRGLMVQLPIVGRVIPIVEDDYVVMPDAGSSDPKAKMATGFLKVTPAHDPNDYEIGRRHELEMINVMAPDASISDSHGWDREARGEGGNVFIGKSREEARELVVREFEARNLLESVKPHSHSVGHSDRSKVAIEPYLSDQWYVKVTDDRLVGEAQRALSRDQRSTDTYLRAEGSPRRAAPVRKRSTPPTSSSSSPLRTPIDYFITFTTYGTWLHGDDRGSADRAHNTPGTPMLNPDEERRSREFESLKSEPIELDRNQRRAVAEAVDEVCEHRRWVLHACNVRQKHVHVVVTADRPPERVMNDFKSYATRRLRRDEPSDAPMWTRHGSTKYLDSPSSFDRAITYVLDEQGEDLGGVIDRRASNPLPHGRGSSSGGAGAPSDGESNAGDHAMRFYPPRYAKTYEAWHDNLRDWCISRQLWWGHRIPVWSKTEAVKVEPSDLLSQQILHNLTGDSKVIPGGVPEDRVWIQRQYDAQSGQLTEYVCARSDATKLIDLLESNGFTQDPDVLDTWFSSALWPMSTMGWPDPSQSPEFTGLLEAFNPTNVLSTGRDIITLWVSRMAMFNRFLLGDGATERRSDAGEELTEPGPVPFYDVYIHPIIQDGHGQRMSKSLGNGVDPLDLIHSHGADALRFGLCQIATATQDVRMPVDLACPHCGKAFEPRQARTPQGYIVAAPEQECPACGKAMVSAYGVSSGSAKPSDDKPLARNTSTRLDEGRNFCNKLWNASRFAISMLGGPAFQAGSEGSPNSQAGSNEENSSESCATSKSSSESRATSKDSSESCATLPLPDRWMLSRLARAIDAMDDALAEYQFARCAEIAYDLLWRDFCDWYLESIKPTIAADPLQQAVLRSTLDSMLRLLHPLIPFVTEAIYERLREVETAPVPGLELPEPTHGGLLCTAPWPSVDDSWRSDDAEADFERLQTLVRSIRDVRSQQKVHPRRKITLHVDGETATELIQFDEIVCALAGIGTIAGPEIDRPDAAVAFRFGDRELHLSDLADALDADAERDRLTREIAELEKSLAALDKRLSNPGYTEKAPTHLVEETRNQRDKAASDLAAARSSLEDLG